MHEPTAGMTQPKRQALKADLPKQEAPKFMTTSHWMLVKLLLIVGLVGAFTWWQFRDLAREKKRTDAQKKLSGPAGPDDDADRK